MTGVQTCALPICTRYVNTGKVRLAYLNFPLQQHPHARETAELALCAGLQDKFWQYHDALFRTQNEWTNLPANTPYFYPLAAKTGIDTTSLRACYASHALRPMVDGDTQRALDQGVRGTPAFFVGQTHRFDYGPSGTDLRKALDEELRAAGGRTSGPGGARDR